MFVFLIDQNPLITEWLKRQALLRSVPFYAMDSLKEAAYFINDLSPQVLVLDGATIVEGEDFLREIEAYPLIQQLPVIGLGAPLPAWSQALKIRGHLAKPLNPERFHEDIAKILGVE